MFYAKLDLVLYRHQTYTLMQNCNFQVHDEQSSLLHDFFLPFTLIHF